ncbi:MAG: aminotransferase class V-fold PLP-dependent enzyme [Clostridia bacterium]|nr:aminotransferase class V-fold PLP-dependent enzyme [Clostridia bacterium]
MNTIYFDNSASAIPCAQALGVFAETAKIYANPSSLHSAGLHARRIIENARAKAAAAFRCQSGELVFTSGGTESNNTAVRGLAHKNRRAGNVIVTTRAEHPSVVATALSLEREGYETVFVASPGGVPDPDELESVLKSKKVCLVTLMQANNQNGAVTDLKKVREIMESSGTGALLHSDCVQSFLKLPEESASDAARFCDAASVSAHKIGGVKGTGALFVRKGIAIPALMTGGEQENGVRAGTENIAGICAMAEAVAHYGAAERAKVAGLREYIINSLREQLGENVVITEPPRHIDSLFNFALVNVKSEVALNYLNSVGVCVSSSSACSSKAKTNAALASMGYGAEYERSALRIGISPYNTKEECDLLVAALKGALAFRIKGK